MSQNLRPLPLVPLRPTEAHVWQVPSHEVTDPTLLEAYAHLLCPEERQQQQRFHFEKGRHEYLLTHALVRTTLSRYVAIDPRSWRFEKNAYGKPAIAYPRDILPLSFNVSHTNGLIVCLVALGREVGIDVEDMERPGETVEIADRFFSPAEVADLRALPTAAQHYRFFEYWTLKEAYIKARGLGLSLPLEQFSFHFGENHSVRISFDPRLQDDPHSWQFTQLRPSSRHVMALAIRRGADLPLDVHVKWMIPLR